MKRKKETGRWEQDPDTLFWKFIPDNPMGASGQHYIDRLVAGSARPKPTRPAPHVMRAGRLRNELARLAAERMRHGECLPDGATAYLLARIAIVRAGTRLTILDVEDVARMAEIPMPPASVVVPEVHRASAEARLGTAWRLPTADLLGDLFGVKDEEHKALGLRAIGVACSTVEGRRRGRDRYRKQTERAAKGAKPRAESLSATKPWEAEGLSRATWYRRQAEAMQAAETGSSVHNYKKDNSVDETVSQRASRVRSSLAIDDATIHAVIVELDTLVGARQSARASSEVRIMTAAETRSRLLGRAAEAFARMAEQHRPGSGSIAA